MHSANENVVIAGEFNIQVGEKSFATFLYQYELTSINKNPICYKNPNHTSCTGHTLINFLKSFFKKKLFSQGSQISITWFYLYLSYIFQKQKRHDRKILRVSKRMILIEICRIGFQQNV